MESTTPARRKAAEPATQEQTLIKKGFKNSIKRKEIDESKLPVTFKAPKAGNKMILLQRAVSVFDPVTSRVRGIRYCPQEHSIWVDEQSKESVTEPIVFTSGHITVPIEKPNLIAYLRAHPDNGKVFHEVKRNVVEEVSLEDETQCTKAQATIVNADIDELYPIAIYYGIDINEPSRHIKLMLIRKVKDSVPEAKFFNENWDSTRVKNVALVQQCLEFGILTTKGQSVAWADGDNIVTAPAGFQVTEELVNFLEQPENHSTVQLLYRKLNDL